MKKIIAAVMTFGFLATGAHAFTTRDVQKGLIYLGYNPGPVDGAMGSKTRAAFKQFWLDEFGEEYSGKIDKHDYSRIGHALNKHLFSEDMNAYSAVVLPELSLEFNKPIRIKAPGEYPFTNGDNKPVHPQHSYTVQHPYVLDINGDQCSDLLLQYMDSYQHPRILFGDKNIVSTEAPLAKTFPATTSIRNIAQKDLDGDGRLDFVGFTSPHILERNGRFGMGQEKDVLHLTSSGTTLLPYTSYAHGGLIGDVNGDKIDDIFPVQEFPNYKRFALVGDGKGKFEKKFRVRLPFNTMISDAVSADFNGDGIDDFAFLSAADPRFNKYITPEYYRKNGSFKIAYGEAGKSINELTFQSYGDHWMSDQHWTAWRLVHKRKDFGYDGGADSAYTAPSKIDLFDADDDGDLDILVGYFVSSNSSWLTSGFEVYENLGDRFVDATDKFVPFQMANQSLSIPTDHFLKSHHIDINNDGKKDLVLTMWGVQKHATVSSSIYLQTNGQYIPVNAFVSRQLGDSQRLYPGDFNCDGNLDFFTWTGNHAEIRWGSNE